ncbi:hypothetical protein [Thalassolituus maritimus]|uniref:7-cyano-7-deazaguanine synthase (Queuosine biosynthesis) n=1 Tax=Thalassolituus maritimus TaxID=484498 RepID=A0ABQ0A2J5_9GAMM
MKIFKRFSKSSGKSLPSDTQKKLQDFAELHSSLHDKGEMNVHVEFRGEEVLATDGKQTFYFLSSEQNEIDARAGELALWAFLPVAMARGLDLKINAPCSEVAIKNAHRLIEAWSCWLPNLFSLIHVSATSNRVLDRDSHNAKELFCFSGGVDSTYTLLTRNFPDHGFDILTVQGMDYNVADDARFEQAKRKSQGILKNYDCSHFFVKTNAYDVYKKYQIQPRYIYVFVLMACASLYSRKYSSLVLAADRIRYQQLEDVPYGSSYATDHYFDSGDFRLVSHADDATRAQKLPVIAASPDALESVSFCKDRKYRPENCGVCEKCMRTKYMFLASIGYVPVECFKTGSMQVDEKVLLSKNAEREAAFVKATYAAAFWSGNLSKVPMIEKAYKKLKS